MIAGRRWLVSDAALSKSMTSAFPEIYDMHAYTENIDFVAWITKILSTMRTKPTAAEYRHSADV
jgi:hypothetical protein